MKKTQRKQVVKQGKGKNEEGRYDGSVENSTMFPVTCRDGLFQFRFNEAEKSGLVGKAKKEKCKMAELFVISGIRFRDADRASIKNMVLSQVSDITKNNYRSVVQYVKEKVIA